MEFPAYHEKLTPLMTIYATSRSTSVKSGAMMAVNCKQQKAGSIGDCDQVEVINAALRVLRNGREKCVAVYMGNDIAE